jgi:hypothetical protein
MLTEEYVFYHQAMDKILILDENKDGVSWFKDDGSFYHFDTKYVEGSKWAIDFSKMDLVLLGKLAGGQL